MNSTGFDAHLLELPGFPTRVPRACSICRERKIKCLTESQDIPCTRCHINNLHCEYLPTDKEHERKMRERRLTRSKMLKSNTNQITTKPPSGLARRNHARRTHAPPAPYPRPTSLPTNLSTDPYGAPHLSVWEQPTSMHNGDSYLPLLSMVGVELSSGPLASAGTSNSTPPLNSSHYLPAASPRPWSSNASASSGSTSASPLWWVRSLPAQAPTFDSDVYSYQTTNASVESPYYAPVPLGFPTSSPSATYPRSLPDYTDVLALSRNAPATFEQHRYQPVQLQVQLPPLPQAGTPAPSVSPYSASPASIESPLYPTPVSPHSQDSINFSPHAYSNQLEPLEICECPVDATEGYAGGYSAQPVVSGSTLLNPYSPGYSMLRTPGFKNFYDHDLSNVDLPDNANTSLFSN